jgi:glycosyltransferase involved in cell wall biosynthesis
MGQGTARLISVILPTYNRALFLTEAFASIADQQHRNWELIVVDDGSTDETSEVLDRLVPDCPGPVRVVRQPNAGAYAARNTGLDQATGDAVAFFDSDDLWLPHHLERCAQALVRHPEVDWVFGACRMVEMDSDRELAPTTFYVNGRPRPFLSLRTLADGELRVIDDQRATSMQIEHGLYCGLQNSVVRRSVFEHRRFWSDYLVVEDEMFTIRLLAAGGRFAYFDNPHVLYRVHADNSSGSATGQDTTRQRRIFSEMVRGLERVGREAALSSSERRALARRLAKERFWGLGYSAYWQAGETAMARACYRQALMDWPWSPAMWKTFAASFVKRAPTPPSCGVV